MDNKIIIVLVALTAGVICIAAIICMPGNNEQKNEIESSFDSSSFTITGNGEDFYSIEEGANGECTVKISGVPEDGIVHVEGNILGNIIIEIGEDEEMDLELENANITSYNNSPIVILSADSVTITAKKDSSNTIKDMRSEVGEEDYEAAIHAKTDLDVQGKGELTVVSSNNNGINSKKDLTVKNLTLIVNCCDNALKGHNTVCIQSGDITLISTKGDGIKTTESDTKYNDDGTVKKQNGTVTLSSEKGDLTLNIYAACEGIDSSYDVIIEESEDNKLCLNIYTDEYSEYSQEVTDKEAEQDEEDEDESERHGWSSEIPSITPGEFDPSDIPTDTPGQFKPDMQGQDGDFDPSSITPGEFDPSDIPSDTPGQFKPDVPGQDGESEPSQPTVPDEGQNDLNPGFNPFDTTKKTGKSYSTKGIKAANSVLIRSGTVSIESLDDCIHANNDTAVETELSESGFGKGYVEVSGGEITLITGDDAIHADQDVLISDGIVLISECFEGIEGQNVTVSGGHISIHASDDGINSIANTSESTVISGGYLYVDAGGDAIDSNSSVKNDNILFSGGNVVLFSDSSNNTTIDSDSGYRYTGGNVVSICASGSFSMDTYNCQNFSEVGSKSTMSVTKDEFLAVSDEQGTIVTVKIPESIRNSVIVYLGSNDASFETTKTTTAALNDDGVLWE